MNNSMAGGRWDNYQVGTHEMCVDLQSGPTVKLNMCEMPSATASLSPRLQSIFLTLKLMSLHGTRWISCDLLE